MHYKFHFSSRLLLIIFFCLLIYIQIVANFIKNHSTSPNKNVALQVRYFCFHLFHTGKLQSKSYSKKIEYIRWSAEWISKWRWHSYSEWRAEQCKVHGVFGDFLSQTNVHFVNRVLLSLLLSLSLALSLLLSLSLFPFQKFPLLNKKNSL